MTYGSLFSGGGGLDLGLERAGLRVRWQCEKDPYASAVLRKHWPEGLNLGDIEAVDWSSVEPVDAVVGGFPCQDLSVAGRGVGLDGERSGLWREFARCLREVRPRWALVENVPTVLNWNRTQHRVQGELAEIGYRSRPVRLPASLFGAPHLRWRCFFLAYDASQRWGTRGPVRPDSGDEGQPEQPLQDAHLDGAREQQPQGSIREFRRRPADGDGSGTAADVDGFGWAEGRGRSGNHSRPGFLSYAARHGGRRGEGPLSDFTGAGFQIRQEQEALRQLATAERTTPADPDGEPLVWAAIARGERHAWTVEPGVVRMVHGVPHRVDRIRVLGNAVVPQVAEFLGLVLLAADAQLRERAA